MDIQKYVLKEVGKRLKQFRESLGLSQKEFASRLGIPPNYISRYEAGKHFPSPSIIEKMKDVFGLDDYWLATGIRLEDIVQEIGEKPRATPKQLLDEMMEVEFSAELLKFIFSKAKPFDKALLQKKFSLSADEAESCLKTLLSYGIIVKFNKDSYIGNPAFVARGEAWKDSKFIALVRKLELIYEYGDLKDKAAVRGIIEEVYDGLLWKQKTSKKRA